nr:immunoglobulin heavy chain junction region [Mus musculus]
CARRGEWLRRGAMDYW